MSHEKIMCPYCVNGVEMVMSMSGMYMRCPKCGSTSPTVFDIESAFTAREAVVMGMAARRYVPPAPPPPPNRPLTPEDFVELPMAVWWERRKRPELALRLYQSRIGVRVFSIDGEGKNIEFMREYGKKWRAWACKPTDAEREAAPWEV